MQLQVIAYAKNGFSKKFGIPRQSREDSCLETRIVFEPDYRVREALRGLEDYSHLWLLWGFSENENANEVPSLNYENVESTKPMSWSPTVRPPRLGGNKRVGVFATRSPFRPNSLGLTVVKLIKIEDTKNGKTLVVTGADLVDGTPIFDIKPYLPYVDSVPHATGSFSDEHKNEFLKVVFMNESENIIKEDEKTELSEILSLNPKPSYQNDDERIYGLSYKDLSVKFSCDKDSIYVLKIERV